MSIITLFFFRENAIFVIFFVKLTLFSLGMGYVNAAQRVKVLKDVVAKFIGRLVSRRPQQLPNHQQQQQQQQQGQLAITHIV